MHRPQEQVLDFHRAMGLRTAERHPLIDWRDSNGVRRTLICEEVAEWEDAVFHGDQHGAIREACDILYVVYGWAVSQGIDLQPYFEEVHRTNMLKASGDKREDGKQLKPEGWQPPNIAKVTHQHYGTPRLQEQF